MTTSPRAMTTSRRTMTLSAAAVLLAAAAPASGFAPPRAAAPSPSALPMSTLAEDPNANLLSYASLCARSDACSIDSAESYLKEIMNVQSGCAAGELTGGEVCDDVLGATQVAADLRAKIREGAQRRVGTFWGRRMEELGDLAARADEGPGALLAAPVKPAYLAVLALYFLAVASALQPGVVDASGVVPFTAQEVWYAVRDGYAADLASHAFRHGGLLVGDALGTTGGEGVVPFTLQDAWWAVRDGYAGDLAGHAFRNGGLLVGDASEQVGSSLCTPRELFWSIRDGYFGDDLLSSGAEGGAPVPFAPQELDWAVRHGFSYDMVARWFRDVGLVV